MEMLLKAEEAKFVTIGTLTALILISNFEDVFKYPQLAEIGGKDRQIAFVRNMVDNVYLSHGKNMEATAKERELASTRFANKYPRCTIGDVVQFGDMLMDGQIEIERGYLTLVSFFQAWKVYQMKRGEVMDEIERGKRHLERQMIEVSNDALFDRIKHRIAQCSKMWEEFLASRPKGWQPAYDAEGKLVEYKEYREARLREYGIIS